MSRGKKKKVDSQNIKTCTAKETNEMQNQMICNIIKHFNINIHTTNQIKYSIKVIY